MSLQIFIGEKSDYLEVYPISKESNATQVLQNFRKDIGLLLGIKKKTLTLRLKRIEINSKH